MQGIRLYLSLLSALMFISCSPDRTHLEQIKFNNTLNVVTRNSLTTYYEGPFGATGLEYDLARSFADTLGVRLNLIVEEDAASMFTLLTQGKADIVAAGLTVTRQRRQFLDFGPSYMRTTPQLVYRINSSNRRPRKIADLVGKQIEIVTNSSHADIMKQHQKTHHNLQWHESNEHNSDELMQLVWSRLIDYTVADSIELKLKQRFYPELAAAFDLKQPDNIAWALHKGVDNSLLNEVNNFFEKIKDNNLLKILHNKYYGHVVKFSYIDNQTYKRDIQKKLPRFINHFKAAAKKYNLDWRLLSAVGYQESHWEPDAISPTGVRGIMMLTNDTAKFVGIRDRLDPIQSIVGGARYLRYMINKIPKRIKEPDRTWMALAAYNIGYGHLEDARKITQKRGGNPDQWVDVKDSLPLLSKKRWYIKTKHGYARGYEPVHYVSNIRNYYELLAWSEEEDTRTYQIPLELPANITSPAL